MTYNTIDESSQTNILTAEDLQHHSLARKYALNLIDSVLKHKSNGAMTSEIRDIAKKRYNLDGIENERMLHNIVRNIAYDSRFERQDFIDPDTGRFLGSDYCHVKMKEQYKDTS